MGPINMFPRIARYVPSIPRKLSRPYVHHQIYPSRSSLHTFTDPSAHSSIRDCLAIDPVDKWGWVIYRCTYADDATWAQFRDRIEALSREDIAESDAPEIAERLEWTWIEDKAGLDGISTAALRKRFRAWVTDEIARQQLTKYEPDEISRFRYFIKIDQEAMDSFAGMSMSTLLSDTAYLKIVNSSWEPIPAVTVVKVEQADEQDDDDWWNQEELLDPIDGCTEDDVGWMRIEPFMIKAYFYETLESSDESWNLFYKRPPRILRY
jgi:hypothetical protein